MESEVKLDATIHEEQRRIVAELDALQAEVDALKRLHAETTPELDALLTKTFSIFYEIFRNFSRSTWYERLCGRN
jgi:hypothetical protein